MAGDRLLSLYDLPGLVFAVEGVSPGIPWYISWPQDDKMNAYYISKSDLSHSRKLYLAVLLQGTPSIGPRVLEALEQKGFKFPQDFKRLGSVRYYDQKVVFFVSK
jgi:hypothetical protein